MRELRHVKIPGARRLRIEFGDGCRTEDGEFDKARFAEQAVDDQVKMIEIKVSQGAKAGHGGGLPAAGGHALRGPSSEGPRTAGHLY